jgi:putative ribosome biogenesis GTPase RsgA
MVRILKVLSGSALHQDHGSSVHNLYKQAVSLSKFQPPSTRIVGLVGDSGVGKSSLINSLLDRKDLAKAVRDTLSIISMY